MGVLGRQVLLDQGVEELWVELGVSIRGGDHEVVGVQPALCQVGYGGSDAVVGVRTFTGDFSRQPKRVN